MRENSTQLIGFCATLTVPATETKSVGLPADLLAGRQALELSWFLQRHLDNFIVTPNLTSIYRDWQKPRHRDADGN